MERINTSTAAPDLFGPGKDGFTDGDPGLAPETALDAAWFNAVQEELANAVEASGQELDLADNTQLHKAIQQPVTQHEAEFHANADGQRARRYFFSTN